MISLALRIMATTLGMCFIVWWMYVSWLGIKVFFRLGDKTKKSKK